MFRILSFRRLKWSDSEDIAEKLFLKNKQLDPLSVKFTELHRMVCDLPELTDHPDESNESKLENIQMAWLEIYQDEK